MSRIRLDRRGTLIVALPALSTALLLIFTFATGAHADRTALSKPPNNLGLVGYWSFDDGAGTTATDFSGNGSHGTLQGDTQWTSGRLGKVLKFDGSGDYVSTDFFPGESTLGQKFTWSFWNKYYSFASNTGSHGSADEPRLYTQITSSSGGLRAGIGSDFWDATVLGTGALNKWLHIVFVFDEGEVRTYVDGELVHTRSNVSFSGESNQDFSFGRGFGNERYMNGETDEHRIYNRALSQAEIERLYRAGTVRLGASSAELHQGSSLERGLVGHWTFDGPDTQSTITDRSGMGNHGYFIGGATSSAKTIGKLGQALKFDGVDDSVGQITIPNMTQYAVSAWVKRQAGAGGDPKSIVSGRTSPTGYFSLLAIRNNDNRFYSYRSSQDSAIYSDFVVPENEYVHLASVQTGSDHILYANGVEVARRSNHISYSALELVFGRGFSGRYYKGDVDDVRIYNRALSPDEIKQLYNLGQTVISR